MSIREEHTDPVLFFKNNFLRNPIPSSIMIMHSPSVLHQDSSRNLRKRSADSAGLHQGGAAADSINHGGILGSRARCLWLQKQIMVVRKLHFRRYDIYFPDWVCIQGTHSLF